MKRIFGYFKNYVFLLIAVIIVKFIGTALDLVIPFLLSHILDDVIPTVTKENFMPLIYYGIAMLICSGLAFFLSVKANQLASYISSKCTFELRNHLFKKIESLSCRQIDQVGIPSLITRVSTDTYNIHRFYDVLQRLGLRAPILFFGGIIVSLFVDVKLTLILLCALPFVVIISVIVAKIGIPLYRKIQTSSDSLVRNIRENLNGIRVIKALSKEEYEKGRFRKVNEDVINYEIKSGKVMSILNPGVNLIMNVSLALVVLFGAYLANDGLTSSGKIIAMMSYFSIILNSMIAITRIFTVYSKASVSATRIDYIMQLPEDEEKCVEQEISTHFIEYRNVNFSYNGKENNLTNINLTLEEGQSLGIIGATGSGKTTLLNMLMRFYDVSDGDVFVNYRNVKSYDDKDLKALFGSVFQNDLVFNMSVKDNVDFARNLEFSAIQKACETSQFSTFIERYENKYDEVMKQKGSNLSGGQKQRLLIARALAGNNPILVFDDSSSALDYKTDANMRKAIKDNYPNKTLIIVSQRLSSIVFCDKIALIDEGKIIALGTHEELMKNSSVYQEIYSSQMGGE